MSSPYPYSNKPLLDGSNPVGYIKDATDDLRDFCSYGVQILLKEKTQQTSNTACGLLRRAQRSIGNPQPLLNNV